ncbi:calcium/proton exchanger [Colletotrichum salicis]|uniref:Calcium/proton exchanger n=1 Tax=Colletotrichum salicis TaxID=1209931 RepID=A0A135V7E4_9PEZI|nr:calcium/proton exchanger [Colletotrichum salicis]
MSTQRSLDNVRLGGITNQRNECVGTIDEESPLLNHDSHLTTRDVCLAEGYGDQGNIGSLFYLTYYPNTNTVNATLSHPSRVWSLTRKLTLICYIPFLLAMVSLGIIAGRHCWNPNKVLAFNLTAVSLLTVVLEFSTKQVSLNLPDALGGLLYAVLGNISEFIIGIIALRNDQVEIVQSLMLGSILSSLLLFMGMCFFVGNIVNMRGLLDAEGIQQSFSPIVTKGGRSNYLKGAMALDMYTVIGLAFYFPPQNIPTKENTEDKIS